MESQSPPTPPAPPKRFRSNFRFALHKERATLREEIPLNQIEKLGNILSWCGYELRTTLQKFFRDPRTITVLVTLFWMNLTSFVFYPVQTFDAWDYVLTALFKHINWAYVKFVIWTLTEITILGTGMRAFGRFSNKALMNHYGIA